ncbi:cytochrome P450 [Allokutzneria multivorans]|uniref:Cytochrome P450 n=1 Tax=Allokutzneria multivorans TaxID=1142134 RepID=A0ABP7SAR9_9PSEU
MTGSPSTVPRAPGRLPLLGHAWPLLRRPLELFQELRPLGDIVRLDIGSMPVYVLTSPDVVHQVLVAGARGFEKGRLFDRLRPLLGNGLPVAEGEFHRCQRRLVQPGFHHTRFDDYARIMARHAERVALSWEAGRRLALDSELHELVMAITAEALTSAEAGKDLVREIHRSLPTVARGVIIRALAPKALDRLPIPLNRKFGTAATRLLTAIDDVIERYRSAGIVEGDLLSMLLTARDPDSGAAMSDRQVRDETLTLLVGGTETTATALAWVFHELGRHPEVEDRVRAEVTEVVGDRSVELADLERMPYLDQVLHEGVRLHSLPLLMRRAITTVTVGGVEFPEGTEFALSQYALHRDPRTYPRPERFEPERWESIPRSQRNRVFIPFGAGTRKCLGDTFAWTEMAVILATLVTRWRLAPAPGHQVREIPAASPRPDALPMIVTEVPAR